MEYGVQLFCFEDHVVVVLPFRHFKLRYCIHSSRKARLFKKTIEITNGLPNTVSESQRVTKNAKWGEETLKAFTETKAKLDAGAYKVEAIPDMANS